MVYSVRLEILSLRRRRFKSGSCRLLLVQDDGLFLLGTKGNLGILILLKVIQTRQEIALDVWKDPYSVESSKQASGPQGRASSRV